MHKRKYSMCEFRSLSHVSPCHTWRNWASKWLDRVSKPMVSIKQATSIFSYQNLFYRQGGAFPKGDSDLNSIVKEVLQLHVYRKLSSGPPCGKFAGFHGCTPLMPFVASSMVSRVIACSSPRKPLSSVRKSMQWHSCSARLIKLSKVYVLD